MKKQIFISYRRDGGDVMAKMLCDRLSSMGYEVFYDIESLKSGAFDTKLYEEIEACTDFILILPKNALNNCIYEGDWVRCEIRHALEHNKNIIPIYMRDFAFPMEMPDDINAIRRIQAVDFTTMDYFDSRVDKIVDMLLSKPRYTHVRAEKGPQINKIVAYGTNGSSTTPANGFERYNTINIEEYENVCFGVEVDLNRSNMPDYTLVIVDEGGSPVFDCSGVYYANEGDKKMIITWKIKENGYPLVVPGKYRTSICVDNSEQYTAGFEVIFKPVTSKKDNESKGLLNRLLSRKRPSSIETHLSYAKGGKLAVFYAILMLLAQYIGLPAIAEFDTTYILVGLVILTVTAVYFIRLLKYNVKYIFGSLIISLLVLLPGISYLYCIYLFFKGRECKKICVKHKAIEKKISTIIYAEQ